MLLRNYNRVTPLNHINLKKCSSAEQCNTNFITFASAIGRWALLRGIGFADCRWIRKDAGVVERAALEMRWTGNCSEGSNPSLSAEEQKNIRSAIALLYFFTLIEIVRVIRATPQNHSINGVFSWNLSPSVLRGLGANLESYTFQQSLYTLLIIACNIFTLSLYSRVLSTT